MDEVAALWANPGDAALREVVLDRWIETGDPRAAFGVAHRRREPIPDAVLDTLPGPADRQVRVTGGFVVEVAWSLDDFADGPPPGRPLADHPLAVARIRLPRLVGRPSIAGQTRARFEEAWTRFVLTCGGVRGVWIEGLTRAHWSTVCGWLDGLRAQVLGLEIDGSGGIDPPTRPWTSVRAALLAGIPSVGLADWLEALPNADRIALRDRPGQPLVRPWLDVERGWTEADLRGCTIHPADAPRLARRATTTWVRSPERFETRGRSPLDDPFGDRGRILPPPGPTHRHAAVTETRWAQSEGATLRFHRDDAPDATYEAPRPVTAMTGAGRWLVWGDDRGAIYRSPLDVDRVMPIHATVPGPVLELAGAPDGSVAYRTPDGHGTVDERGRVVHHAEVVDAVTLTHRGLCVARDTVLRGPFGEVDVGDPIHALAGFERIRMVAGRWVYTVLPSVDRTGLSVIARTEPGVRGLASRGRWTAWADRGAVFFDRESPSGSRLTVLGYGSVYQDRATPLSVADIALHEDGTLLVALEGGGANLCVWPDILKLDEFADQPSRSWFFVVDGVPYLAR